MKQDNNDMIMIINNELENTRLSFGHTDLVKEIVQSLDNKSLDDELEYLLLSELYKYIKLCNTIISIDPRGDHSIKFNALYYIKKSLENNSITKDSVEGLKKVNDTCLDYFLNPLKMKKQAREFYSKHPGAKF